MTGRVLHSFPTRRSSDLRRVGGHDESIVAQERHERRVSAIGAMEVVVSVIKENARAAIAERRRGHDGIEALVRTLHVRGLAADRKSTRLNSSHGYISYAV